MQIWNETERQLLSELVDKYERTSAFRRGEPPKQRVRMKLYDEKSGRVHTCYNVENSGQRQAVNSAVLALAELGLVEYDWLQWEQGNLLASVWLVYSQLSAVYKALNRTPKRDKLDQVCLELLEAIDQCHQGWGQDFLQGCYQSILHAGELGKQLPDDDSQRHDLLRCIVFASQPRTNELLERVFSIQCLGNSKGFEKHVRGRLLSILRTAFAMDEEESDEAVLRQIGIAKYPEQFEFCGDVSLVTPEATTHFGQLRYGAALFRGELENATLRVGDSVTEILTIENRANYIHYITYQKRPQQVVLYHGGQYSPAKKGFFLHFANHGQWHHWGDIDWGGFTMLSRLRREVVSSVEPYRMGVAELQQYAGLCTDFSVDYGKKLESLLSDPLLADCREIIGYMLQKNCRLEQEALL